MKTGRIKLDQHFPRSRGDARSEPSNEDQQRIVCPTCEGSGFLVRPKQPTKIDLDVVTSKLKNVSRVRTGKLKDRSYLDTEYSPISISCPSERSGSVSPPRRSYTKRIRDMSASRCLARADNQIRGRSESPSNYARQIKLKFKDMSDENALVEGLNLVVQLARDNNLSAKEHMSPATRALCSLLRSHKASTIRKACSIITELFQMINLVFRPEFDELVAQLMIKTGDLNQKVKLEASEALTVMATFAPTKHLVRAVHVKGPSSKSPQVRLAAILALDRVVSEISLTHLFTSGSMRDTRKQIIQDGCSLLKDQNSDVRKVAKNMMLKLMEREEFEDVLHLELEHDDYKNIEKSIICLKYGENKSV